MILEIPYEFVDFYLKEACIAGKLENKDLAKPTGNLAKSEANSFAVLHFGWLDIDKIISNKNIIWTVEKYKEVFLGSQLILGNRWLKYRTNLNKQETTYSLKEVCRNGESLNIREAVDVEEIKEKLGAAITSFQPWATFYFTRWSVQINELIFYIDSCKSNEETFNYHVSCGCRAAKVEDIINAFNKDEFETLGLTKETLLYPVPSKVMEYIYSEKSIFNQLQAEDKELLEEFDEYRGFFHRYANPLDTSKILQLHATAEEVQKWCRNLFNGKFSSEFEAITSNLNATQLYDKTPQDFIDLAESANLHEDLGIALYFLLHLWQSPYPNKVEILLEKAKENVENIAHFTLEEIQLLLNKNDLDEAIKEKCEDYHAFWVFLKNKFVDWSVKEGFEPIYL